MSFASIRGQATALRILEHAIDSDRVASSYLFEGPSGVGKQMAALALAARVIGGDAKTEARIREGTHPDVRVFLPREEGRRNIQVEALREQILPFAQFAPFEANAAFLVFPEADVSFPETPAESANALLKTLEEPRPRVHFILTSERPDRLLPTIRSRCQRVRFSRLPSDLIDDILRAHDVDEAARGPAIALAGGRADRALRLADGEADALLGAALELDDACTQGGPGALSRVAESVARSELDLATILEAWIAFYRDVAGIGFGLADRELSFRYRAEVLRARAARVSPADAAERVHLIEEALVSLERNGNPQVVLDALVFGARVR